MDPPASNGGSRGSGATGSKWGTPTAEARPPLAPEVQADLRAIQARVQRRLRPALGHVESKVYDRFLKANAVKSGIASYGLFVELLLGTRFGSGWVPVRRARP